MNRAVHLVTATVTALLAFRVLHLFSEHIMRRGGTMRFHVESAALAFVIVGLAARIAGHTSDTGSPATPRGEAHLPLGVWLVFCAGAVALYWRAMSVGLLSDDFVLVSRATDWNLHHVSNAFFRPLPLAIWGVVLHAGRGPWTLHLLNILLHATNAYLAACVVAGWIDDRRWSIAAGALVLASPLAPESVVWCSGVFDLLATTLVLITVLVARRYVRHPTYGAGTALVVGAFAAVASKETAVVGVVMVLVDAWMRGALTRPLWSTAALVSVVLAAFSALRLSADRTAWPALTKFAFQRAAFASFGALADPWHVQLIDRYPWMPIVAGALVLGLVTAFLATRGSARWTWMAIGAAACVLLPIVPVWNMFVITPALQGSRYVYLSAVWWAALLVVAASERTDDRWRSAIKLVAIVVTIALGVYGTLFHLRPWMDAAAARDRIEARLPQIGARCSTIAISNLPDAVRGAYVFRNGAIEAFARDRHVRATLGAGLPGCSFEWDESRLSFVPIWNRR